jgi:non-specific serine/threonine protein kinase
MSMRQGQSFGELLNGYRGCANLSQEELAEAARLSVRTISDLERGIIAVPHASTVQLLADALGLVGAERAAFERAARRRDTQVQHLRPPNNLPLALTSFIGREQERARVLELLRQSRLLTLIGAGGCGKTRLALQVAGDLLTAGGAGEYPDGIRLVEYAALADPALVPQATATVLGVREMPGQSMTEALISHLSSKRLLLILDNCEHLIAACAELAGALLHTCRQVRIVATSREALRIDGEQTWRVPSLSIPDTRELPLEQIAEYEAVRLFVERAQATRADFTLSASNVETVVQICRRLDGIPLAIELAAARLSALSLDTLAARLDDRFSLLTTGSRTALPRQQTLRATIDWSHDLLDEQERTLLRRLAVFAGGWSPGAAEAVCAGNGAGGGTPLAVGAVLTLLAGLVNKSLAQLDDGRDVARYRLLETVRQYCWERLERAGEMQALRDRHLVWCVSFAEEAAPALTGQEQRQWLAQLEREHDNLRTALQWASESAKAEPGLRLAGALWRFWYMRGYVTEGRAWLDRLLALIPDAGERVDPAIHALALNGAGVLAQAQDDYSRAALLHDLCLSVRRSLGDVYGIAGSLNNLGLVAQSQGNYARAAVLLEESLSLFRPNGSPWTIATVLSNLGGAALHQGEYERAAALHQESLALRRELGDQQGIATSLSTLGLVAMHLGDYARAETLCEESQALFEGLGDTRGIATELRQLGDLARRRGLRAHALDLYKRSLAMHQEVGDRWGIATCLDGVAGIAREQGQVAGATRLFAVAARLREAIGTPIDPDTRATRDLDIATTRAVMGDRAFLAAWNAAAALSLAQAIDEATSISDAQGPQEDRSRSFASIQRRA